MGREREIEKGCVFVSNSILLLFGVIEATMTTTTPTKVEPAPAQVPLGFGPVTDKNIEQVRVLNEVSFPLRYNEQFYAELGKKGRRKELAIVAYYGYDVMAGAICCRIEAPKEGEGPGSKLYIMTLAVLKAYQRLGIGSRLLQGMLDNLKLMPEVTSVYLHVHTANTNALRFYQRFGFVVEREEKDYYKNLNPPNAVVLRLPVLRGKPQPK